MPTVKLTYLLSILSAEEATKPVSKCLPISASLELGADEPWDRIKVQLLVKIDEALAPRVLNFDDYLTMFFIPRVLPKPGMALSTDENYAALLRRAKNLVSKTPTINLTIQQKKGEMDKENVAIVANAEVANGGKPKKVCFYHFDCIYVINSNHLTEERAHCASREHQQGCECPKPPGTLEVCHSPTRNLRRCILLRVSRYWHPSPPQSRKAGMLGVCNGIPFSDHLLDVSNSLFLVSSSRMMIRRQSKSLPIIASLIDRLPQYLLFLHAVLRHRMQK